MGEKLKKEDMMFTSGYNFEGYRITEYLGFCSGECALGTGIFSEIGAEITDFFGKKSDMYAQKMMAAKSAAFEAMLDQAMEQGANAILGVDIDFVTFAKDIMGVIANGTSVKIQKLEDDHKKEPLLPGVKENIIVYPVVNYYETLVIRPTNLSFNLETRKAKVSFWTYQDADLTAVNVDLLAHTLFGTTYEYSDINFSACRRNGVITETEEVYLEIPLNELKVIQSFTVRIKHYIVLGKVHTPDKGYKVTDMTVEQLLEFRKAYGEDAVNDFSEDPFCWTCMCGRNNENEETECCLCGRIRGQYRGVINPKLMDLSSLLDDLKELSSCDEIMRYLLDYQTKNHMDFSEELLAEVQKMTRMERAYGNMKDSMVTVLEKYFS